MYRAFTVLIVAVLFAPTVLHAVVINEIAWMGSAESPNDEWIELYNNGNAGVSLDGWTLTDNVSLEIPLAGTVGAGELAVLERTDDSSAPGNAFLLYTGALANEGRTLTLRRADDSIEDQVAGGEGWENIGGDNVSKSTAQKTDTGWITAAGTPGKANATVPTVTTSESTKPSQTTAKSTITEGTKPEKISLVLPDNELSLEVVAPTVAFVNQDVSLSVSARGIGESLIDSLSYHWNFGDTYTGSGKETTHAFTHPGEYLVIVSGEYARHSARARHEISILPQALAITKETNDTIKITNSAAYEADISGFVLQGDTRIAFPENTYLLPNASIMLDARRVQKGIMKTVALLDTSGSIVAIYTPNLESNPEAEMVIGNTYLGNELIAVPEETDAEEAERQVSNPQALLNTTKEITVAEALLSEPIPSDAIVREAQAEEQTAEAAQAISAPKPKQNMLPYYGLIGILLLGIIALYTTRSKSERDLP